ncbi:MAG TPA: prepilin-type N-terminal cleavage/methylation domain-containing protein [Nitrospirota bacterium]|nr:prepilin-type N-terminal cleavage/methylation domain-containing protein [Nitrospirota bacterium]
MGQPATKNKGFTLVEMMMAIVIIMVSMMALVTMMMMSMNANLANDMRGAAVRVTNQTAEALLAIPTTPDSAVDPLLSAGTHSRIAGDSANQDSRGFPKIQQSIRGTSQSFNIQWSVTDTTSTVKQIEVNVGYQNLKTGQTFTNSALVFKHSSGM